MSRLEQKLSETIKMNVSNAHLDNGVLSFTVETELDAYKAAYYYRYSRDVKVEFAPNVSLWHVTVRNAR